MSDENSDNKAEVPPNEQAPSSEAGKAESPPATSEPSDREALVAMTAERDRLKDALLRSMADLDNYRKRVRRDTEEAVRKGKEDLLRELLPVFDNLERATQYIDTGADPKAIGKGVEMVLRLFEDTLGKLGGKRIRPVGQPFDPTQHEAIQQIESAEHPVGTVAREEVAGYLFNDRLLRPSMVVVSKGPPASEGDGGNGQN
jgi:molecular chaperone GrpE